MSLLESHSGRSSHVFKHLGTTSGQEDGGDDGDGPFGTVEEPPGMIVTGTEPLVFGISVGDTSVPVASVGGPSGGGISVGGDPEGRVSVGGIPLGCVWPGGGMFVGGISVDGISLGGIPVGRTSVGGGPDEVTPGGTPISEVPG